MALRPQHIAPELLTKVTKALGITALDQWYYVSQTAVAQAIGSVQFLNDLGGTAGFLKYAYPHHQFDEEKLASKKKLERDQKFIEVIIRRLFPNTEIQTKARKAVGITNPETDAYLEIDFWIPSLKLGIEYQDKHHYEYQWYANAALEDYQKRDNIKKVTMPTLGYTLISIGHWWDRSPESLIATIRKFRPDLLQEYESISTEPMQPDPPDVCVAGASVIPGAAGIMSPFVPSSNFNPINWYAGEKHDGIRGVYNPKLNEMFSRAGKGLSILPTLLEDIPNMLVEGEITAGRGNYNKTAVVSFHSHHDKVNWPMFRYALYDIPNSELGDYTQRYSAIALGLSTQQFIFSQLAFRVLVDSKDHLKMLVDTIISDAGEGAIVQKDTLYEYGRAKSLAKIKVHRDADGQVLRINENSCTCKLVTGVTAEIIFCDGFDPSQLKIGDIVSYYYNGYSLNGMPKRGEIYKVRYDVTWEELISDQAHKAVSLKSVKDVIGSSSLVARDTAKKKLGHWNKSRNVREFFDDFAASSGFDPLMTGNWYSVSGRALKAAGCGGLLSAYGFNLQKALTSAYPELKFEAYKFRTHDKMRGGVKKGYRYWRQLPNVHAFLDTFARAAGFDPLVRENWYPVSAKALHSAGGIGLLSAYDYSLKKVLSVAYPELRFESHNFRIRDTPKAKTKMGHWNKQPNVRAFFDEFARTSGFDPLVADNWYSIRGSDVRSAGSGGMLSAHSFSLNKALMHAYPEVKFDVEKFRIRYRTKVGMERGHWHKLPNVRAFFDGFAKTTGFDPLEPSNWYPVTNRALRKVGGGGLLRAYGSLMKALARGYPELRFEATMFRTPTRERNKIKNK